MFVKEEKVIQKVEKKMSAIQECFAKSTSLDDDFSVSDELAYLLGEYRKLLSKTHRLVSTGDRMQRKLNTLNEELCVSRGKYKGIFDHVVEGIFQTGPSGNFLEVNAAFATMFGFRSVELFMQECRSLQDLFYKAEGGEVLLMELENGASVQGRQLQYCRCDGKKIWVEISASCLLFVPSAHPRCGECCGISKQAGGYVGVVSDITEKHQLLDKMCHLAMTDPLTGLYNRRSFFEQASHTVAVDLRQCTDFPV